MADLDMGIITSVSGAVGVSCECTVVPECDCPCVDPDD